jgi:non-ribosomal peptide synthetase component F
VQYADYALWQREWLQGEVLERHLNYWQTQLHDAPVVHDLPLDQPRPAQQTFAGRSYRQLLDLSTSEKVKALCDRHGVTLFMFMQSVFSVLLARVSLQTDIVMRTPVAGRDHADVEGLIGFFVNTLVIRTDLSANPSFAELLQTNKQTILDAYSHQHIPFEILVEKLNITRSLAHHPLVQIYLNVDETVNRVISPTEPDAEADSHVKQSAKTDLTLYVHKSGEQILLYWSYLQDLFAPAFITELVGSFAVLVNQVVSNADRSIQNLPLLSQAGQQQMLSQAGGPVMALSDTLIHQ